MWLLLQDSPIGLLSFAMSLESVLIQSPPPELGHADRPAVEAALTKPGFLSETKFIAAWLRWQELHADEEDILCRLRALSTPLPVASRSPLTTVLRY